MWKKIKDYKLKQDINKQFENLESSNFNNWIHNPAILTPVQYCMYFKTYEVIKGYISLLQSERGRKSDLARQTDKKYRL